jgi:hypothetical protein
MQKSLRIGVHHANAIVWGPVYRTHLRNDVPTAGIPDRLNLAMNAASIAPRLADATEWSRTSRCVHASNPHPDPDPSPAPAPRRTRHLQSDVGVELKGVSWS